MAVSASELGDLVAQLSRLLRRKNRNLGIAPHHFRALRLIAMEPVRPARLAEELNITPRAVTDVIDALTESGLVHSDPDPSDRRAKIVSITQAGEQRLLLARQQRDEMAHELFAHLSSAEKEQLAELLRRVVAADQSNSPASRASSVAREPR